MHLIVGATGQLGSTIAARLLAQGEAVRLLMRSDQKLFANAEIARGDLKDRASLDAACAGVKTVITTANSAQRGGDDNVATVDDQGNVDLIEAAKDAGVEHFIFISAAGADESSPVPLFAAKARAERHLRDSGLRWTVVAPHVFMDVWFPMIIGSALGAQRPVPLVAGGRRRHSFIAVNDVAAFAVAAASNPAAVDQRLTIGGPEALSWTDVVEIAGKLIGRRLEIETIEPGSPIPTLPPPINHVAGMLAAGLEQQDVIIDTSELARTFGVTLTSAETVLRRMTEKQFES